MKRSLKLFAMLIMSGALILLASCNGNEHKQSAADITPPPTAGAVDPTPNKTAAPTETPTSGTEPTTAPETEQPMREQTSLIEQRPENMTIEWLAGELMRRQYASCIALEMLDFSDIIDRNEDTDLYFYLVQLGIDQIKLRSKDNYTNAANKEAKLERIVKETETEITVDIYVLTFIPTEELEDNAIGGSIQITVDKQRMVVIGYDEPNTCDGLYKVRLKPLALRYRNQGLTWEEADKKAYEEIYADWVELATKYPRQTP